jgi:hypothetical protein
MVCQSHINQEINESSRGKDNCRGGVQKVKLTKLNFQSRFPGACPGKMYIFVFKTLVISK